MTPYILSQMRVRSGRTLGVVGGVALGAALFVALSALGNGYREAARRPLAGLAASLLLTRPAGLAAAVPEVQRARGLRLPFGLGVFSPGEVDVVGQTGGVKAAAAALLVWDFSSTSYTTVLGIDPATGAAGPGQAILHSLSAGRSWGEGERSVAVADGHFAAFFGLKPGSSVQIDGRPFQVVGVVQQTDASQAAVANLFVPLADAQALAGLDGGQVNQIYVQVSDAAQVESVVGGLQKRLGTLSAITEDSLLQVMGGVGRVSAHFAGVAAVIGLLAGLLLASLALGGLIAERRREIGLMKALGWRTADVLRSFTMEAMALSLAGGLLGLLLGWGVANALGRVPLPQAAATLAHTLPGMPGAAPGPATATLPVHLGPASLGLALLAAVVGGMLSGWLGARRTAALPAAEALRQA